MYWSPNPGEMATFSHELSLSSGRQGVCLLHQYVDCLLHVVGSSRLVLAYCSWQYHKDQGGRVKRGVGGESSISYSPLVPETKGFRLLSLVAGEVEGMH